MAEDISHSRSVDTYLVPNKTATAADLHGLQDIGGSATIASTDIFVMGKADKCGTDQDTPETTVPVTQYERGELTTYLKIANLTSKPSGGLTLDNFSGAKVDVFKYVRDADDGNILGTIWHPKTAISSLGLNIGTGDVLTRTFDLSGDNEHVTLGDNKYAVHRSNTAPSGTSGNYDITSTTLDPTPVVDPHNSGQYIVRVDRVRSGTLSTLTRTTDWTYDNGTTTLTIVSASADDVYHIYYSASSWGSAGDPTSEDSASPCFLKSENVTILISDGITEVTMDRVTDLSISADINLLQEEVIGFDGFVVNEVQDTPVTFDLTGRVKNYYVEKAGMNSLASSDLLSNLQNFGSTIKVTVKIYSDSTKSTFLLGYQADSLAVTDKDIPFTSNEFGEWSVSLQGANLTITDSEGDL